MSHRIQRPSALVWRSLPGQNLSASPHDGDCKVHFQAGEKQIEKVKLTSWHGLYFDENGTWRSAYLSDWTVYVLYRTDRLDLDPDLNQNLINLLLSLTWLIHQVWSCPFHNFWNYRDKYRFGPTSQWWKITWENKKNNHIQIWIVTRISLIFHGHTPNLSVSFRRYPLLSFWDITVSDRRVKT